MEIGLMLLEGGFCHPLEGDRVVGIRSDRCVAKAIVDRSVDEGLRGDIEVNGRRYGLVLDIGGYYKNVVTLAPSLHITQAEMELSLQLLDRVLHRVSQE